MRYSTGKQKGRVEQDLRQLNLGTNHKTLYAPYNRDGSDITERVLPFCDFCFCLYAFSLDPHCHAHVNMCTCLLIILSEFHI